MDLDGIEAAAPPKKRHNNKCFALGCALLASTTSTLMGYDIGVMSGAMMFIQEDLKVTDTQMEILAGILNVYSLVGSFAAGRTSDWTGRRITIVIAAVFFFLGALLMGLATSYGFLMVGRFVAGIGVGYALMIAPVYTAEVSPARYRGFLTSFAEVFINFGILLGYVSNFAFSGLPHNLGWRVMLGVGAVPSALLAFGALVMPESPRWLVLQGRLGDARRVLAKTSESDEEAELRLSEIKEAAGIPQSCNDDVVEVTNKRSHGKGVWRDLLLRPTPVVRKMLISTLLIHFFQQTSGIDSVVLYSPRVFEKAGMHSKSKLLAMTVAVGFTKTVFILVATCFLDRCGRRPLLLGGTVGMIVSLLGLATGLTVTDHHPGQRVEWAVAICFASVLAYVAFFSVSLGPVTWVYTSEILPLRLRAQGFGLGVAMNRLTSGAISMSFLSLYKAITIGGAFFLYCGVATVAWVFFYTYLPETRGRTLEEMEEVFANKKRKTPSPPEGTQSQDQAPTAGPAA
ncbi:hypothetical protein Taro_044335 [Colocasia esculenta]|uniref:Major facilitator superfamily (MFS) profile domain-containing protein n=1 Tax=Colocasia esculenta TaxID=4460 RepID=A0A843X5C4_COLES|nr:hypothetical protein [Colocasia esculenta]